MPAESCAIEREKAPQFCESSCAADYSIDYVDDDGEIVELRLPIFEEVI